MTGLTDDVEFSYGYDVLGRKTSVSAAVGSTEDYVNGYSYDALGRITQITQDGVTGGNAVAEKRVDFSYSDDGTRATISRFADLAGTKAVAETEKVFDKLGRVTDIVHERAATDFADYDLTWDAASRISDFDFDSLVGDDGDATYSYDDTNQLTGSDYASDWQTDEAYSYDDNGNRTNTGYSTGDHNRLTSDGTYNYTYDNEGNVLTKTNISDSTSVEYTWDHRNRLTKVTFKNSGGTATKIVGYSYDFAGQMVERAVDTNADSTADERRIFSHTTGQIALHFENQSASNLSGSDLDRRYLWAAQAVDSLLADETIDGTQTADDILWPLADNLNTTRDIVRYNTSTDTASVTNHLTYDAFGNVTSETSTAPADDTLFHHTGKILDEHTGNQWHNYRWYNPETARWQSADPIGFAAGDTNLYRYVGNNVLVYVDPYGLQPPLIVLPGQPSDPTGGSDFPDSPIGPPPAVPELPKPAEPLFPGGIIPRPTVPPIITDPGGTIGGIIGGELPEYQNSDEITFLYGLGYHRWKYDAECCDQKDGYCGTVKLQGEGEVECVYVARAEILDVTNGPFKAFLAASADFGAKAQFQLEAQADAALSAQGLNSSSDSKCTTNFQFGSSFTFGGGVGVGDLGYDNFEAIATGVLEGTVNPYGIDLTTEGRISALYKKGPITIGAWCNVKETGDGTSTGGGVRAIIQF